MIIKKLYYNINLAIKKWVKMTTGLKLKFKLWK